MSSYKDVEDRARAYAQRTGAVLGTRLGYGYNGTVFTIENQPEIGPPVPRAAIKVHYRAEEYARERDVYRRLARHGVTAVRGFHVPRLLHHDDALWVIEMTIVSRPFVLDFAGAYLDRPPDFSQEVLADWQAEIAERFEHRLPEVQAVLRALEALGVHLTDVNPGNIAFDD